MSILRKLKTRLGWRKKPEWPANISIGRPTYGLTPGSFLDPMPEYPISVGAYCSFARDVCLLGRFEHPTNRATTFPLRTLLFQPDGINRDAVGRGALRIGSDVWVGLRAIISSGVTIGDGAIVGAGSIVTRDVPPYAIVAGSPARLIRYRFEPHEVEALLAIRWWDWPEEKIRSYEQQFYGPIVDFIARAHREDQLTRSQV